MKITHAEDYMGTETAELTTFICAELDGSDRDRGAVEEARAAADNVIYAFARLCETLAAQNLLTAKDVFFITKGYRASKKVFFTEDPK